MERIQLDNRAAQAVQAYIEYENIVGGADGGKLLSPAEYEEFKKNVAAERANRLFVYWTNSSGLECKTIGPHSKCFCDHRYKDHHTDTDLKRKKVACRVPKCKCNEFNYVPVYGSNDLKCLCKHSYREHNELTKKCNRANCRCTRFSSTHSCSCSRHYNDHETIFYTKDERIAMGKPVDLLGGGGGEMYAALGGLTDFSSLLDGVDRELAGNMPMIEGYTEKALEGPGVRAIEAENREVGRKKKTSGPRGPTVLELYNTPHRYR